jgi:hypothetical protein
MERRSDLSPLARQLAAHQPLFGLQVQTPLLTLRMPTDHELVQLLQVIGEGIHDASFMPFRLGWTDVPSPQREQESLAHWWRCRADWIPYELALVRRGACRRSHHGRSRSDR